MIYDIKELYSIEYDLCYDNILSYLYSLTYLFVCLTFIICKDINVKILVFRFFKLKKYLNIYF